MRNFTISASYTDLYQISMGQVYFLTGRADEPAVFDYFFRKNPFNGGYVVSAGLQSVLEILEHFSFSDDELKYLADQGLDKGYIEFLKAFKFDGDVFAVREGEIVFPNEPIIRVEAPMIHAQLVETMLLNLMNFQSLVATRAARIRSVAGNSILSDFGLRRAQGVGGYHATRAAIIGGFDSTSNVKAGLDLGIPVVGTMAHSFIQSYDDELTAFREFALKKPERCVLLVDTYDTLRSGVPNAITVAKEMESRGVRLQGIRLDSGDLAYLSKQARRMLDEAGLKYVKITASNQLDEYVIKSLLEQGAAIDVFGVGTSLVTAPPDAALDGVYKLALAGGKPRIKLSENLKKLTLPHRKQVHRLLARDGAFLGGDVVTLADESPAAVMYHPYESDKKLTITGMGHEALLHPVMKRGRSLAPPLPLKAIAKFSAERLQRLPSEHKRFEYPHIYKVGVSEKLRNLRNELSDQYRKKQ